MKKKNLLSLMLLCFAFFGVARADVVVIGDATSTTSSYFLPINMYYNYSLTQQIYTACEIGTAGTINSIAFEFVGNSSFTMNNVQVYLKLTDKSSFENTTDMVDLTDATLVWEGTFQTNGAGWITLPLTTTFELDGINNLLVCCYDPTNGYTNTNNKFRTTSTNSEYLAITYYSDDFCPDLSNVSTFSSNKNYFQYRNNIQLDITPDSSITLCCPPDAITVPTNSLTAHEAVLNWEGGSGTYNVEYKKTTDETWSLWLENTTDATTTLTGLDHSTSYIARVQSACGSTWKSVNFTTPEACPAPTNLTCTATTATTATLSWTENGTATSWDLQYSTSPEFTEYGNVQVDDNPVGVIENLTPESIYYARVMAVCGGDDGVSTYSNTVSFEVTAKITIGSGTGSSYYLPTQGNYDYSYTQQIYTVEELGEAGIIESIDFYMVSTAAKTRTLDVYVVSTEKNNFNGNTDWIPVTDADKLFSNSITFETGWTTIPLGDGFIYEGTQNVAIIVDDNSNNYDGGNRQFRTYTASANQSHYCYRDNTDITTTPSGGFTSNAVTTSKNQIRILKSELPDCMKPSLLATTEIAPNYATLSWSQYGEVESWNVEVTDVEQDTNAIWTATANPFTLVGLNPNTEYSVRVSPACDATLWSNAITFTTLIACPAPEDVEVNDATHYTANVTWSGYSDSYTVYYRVVPGLGEPIFSEGFEGGEMPEGWTSQGNSSWNVGAGDANTSLSIGTHSGDYNALITHNNSNNVTYLVTPAMNLADQNDLKLSFWYINRKWSNDTDFFGVYYRIGEEGEWNELWNTTENHETWTNQIVSLPGLTDNYQIGFKMTDKYGYGVGLDDIAIAPVVAIDWTSINPATSPQELTNLTPDTDYEVKVMGMCGDLQSEESEVVTFSTLSENYKIFFTAGNWNENNSWEPAGVPTLMQDVELRANVTIPFNCIAEANSIIQGNHTIIINEGGQLVHNNTGVVATVKKHIDCYDCDNTHIIGGEVEEEEEDDVKTQFDYWYLISNPLTSNITPSASNGLITVGDLGNYDLYDWNATASDGLEWRNTKLMENFSMLYGLYGYLYASELGTNLSFTGTISSSQNAQSRYIPNYSSSYSLGAWALLGNPFVCNAYLVDSYTNGNALPYYKMDSIGAGFIAVEDGSAIAPMQGVLYEAAQSGTVYMSRTVPANRNNGSLNMVVNQGRGTMDNAIIRFGEGQQLGKMSINENNTKVYIPQNGKDYAIVNAGNQGEMPINFKAEQNGTYTLSFTAKEVSFGYLHLIDNMTGANVDLLQTPSYTFEARTTDYTSRFRLVFSADSNSNESNFAIFNNGNLIINNEGNATLQVIDVMGRIMRSETINGSTSINVNAAAGVYMIRLINGENVKVQKVIIK